MRRAFCLAICSFSICATQSLANNWPCFRGQDRMGIAPAGNDAVPIEWSDTQNIVWKTPLPGPGASSPVVWGENVYLTAFSGYGLEKNDPHSNMSKLVRHLLCIDRRNGTIRWKVDLPRTESDVDEHGMGNFVFLHGYASSTPVADEGGIYIYLGRAGVFAFDHAGPPTLAHADPRSLPHLGLRFIADLI